MFTHLTFLNLSHCFSLTDDVLSVMFSVALCPTLPPPPSQQQQRQQQQQHEQQQLSSSSSLSSPPPPPLQQSSSSSSPPQPPPPRPPLHHHRSPRSTRMIPVCLPNFPRSPQHFRRERWRIKVRPKGGAVGATTMDLE
eukprot:TRINITY_DN1384_c1_g1_i1.p2 TRINITY_DN1384_c1_g1~~TRINITY_DN1384_c1_g1_i1.p2  ORF type:complete len:138 (+),score=46.04 TRINITY_DN1384_c1_g1_i1:199-612(+)